MVLLVGLLGLGGRQRALEVVERGQQLGHDALDALVVRERRVARHPLAVVLEVGLRALGERQVLVALGRARAELVEILLDALRRLLLFSGAVGGRRRGGGLVGHHLLLLDGQLLLLLGHGLPPLVHDLGVDDVLLGLRRFRRAVAGTVGLLGLGLLLGALVHRLGDLVERGLQGVGLGADLVGVLAGQRVADGLDGLLDLRLGRLVDLLAELGHLALRLVGGVLAVVA